MGNMNHLQNYLVQIVVITILRVCSSFLVVGGGGRRINSC
jgi:hypothetical protein